MPRRYLIALLVLVSVVAGCAKSELSNEDIAAQKKQYSKENYEKAMIAAGKEKELEAQKKDNADRARDESSR